MDKCGDCRAFTLCQNPEKGQTKNICEAHSEWLDHVRGMCDTDFCVYCDCEKEKKEAQND